MMISLHKNATTTPGIRQRMSGSGKPAAVLALRYGVSEERARKWKQHDVTNPLERLSIEVKCRADVVGIFPNEESILRLIGAVLSERNDNR